MKKHAGGRPREWTLPRAMTTARQVMDLILAEEARVNVFLAFVKMGMTIQKVEECKEKFPRFREFVKEIESIVENRIDEGSISGKFNGRYAMFHMQAKRRWTLPPAETRTDLTITAPQFTVNFIEKQ
jgi:hypothetical protein